jgi:hypothetical protein
MKTRPCSIHNHLSFVCGLLLAFSGALRASAQPSSLAVAGFNTYIAATEARLDHQHRQAENQAGDITTILAGVAATNAGEKRLLHGDVIIEPLSAGARGDLPGALLHDWRGTVFIPRATAAEFERLLRRVDAYPAVFAPQVIAARITAEPGANHLQTWMRVRQKHVFSIVLDASYDVTYARGNRSNGFSASRSTHIFEMSGTGTEQEHPLTPAEEHGFLWRLNTYWTYEERDGGLFLQVETVSLSRDIPAGLGWALRPLLESIPRESLEFTLSSARSALGTSELEQSATTSPQQSPARALPSANRGR